MRIAWLVLVVPALVHAAPLRVLVADRDPELLHALESSLAPWRMDVVADTQPGDPTVRARDADARFVVWRDGADVVVFDRERSTTERRKARAGSFDPVTAAAAALSVKTMMRLPPLGATEERAAEVIAPEPRADHASLRVDLAIGIRSLPGEDLGGLRLRGGLAVRPWSTRGWRFGLLLDAGSSAEVSNGGFKGTWGDLAGYVVGSWSHELGPISIEPSIALGVARSHLDGEAGQTERDESSLDARGLVSLAVRYPLGPLSLAAWLDVELTPGAATYTKTQGMSDGTVLDVPELAVAAGVGIAIELGR